MKIVIIGCTIPLNRYRMCLFFVCNVMKMMTQDMNTGTGWKHWHLSLPRASCWRRVRLVLWCQNWALLITVTAVRSSTLHSSQHKDALDCHTTVCEALRQSLTANGSALWAIALPWSMVALSDCFPMRLTSVFQLIAFSKPSSALYI